MIADAVRCRDGARVDADRHSRPLSHPERKTLMARRKKQVKKSKLMPKTDSPVQPGTIEVVRETMFGPRIVVIRSNAEAAKSMSGQSSTTLARMLGEITADIPSQKERQLIQPDRLVKSLMRNREIQKRLVQKAQEAAEATWPGFNAMLTMMAEREAEFTKALGELGVGVA